MASHEAAMLLKLRAGEKFYINGAVIRFERRATIELLNDATFLLEAHVIQPNEANSPLRQLYFVLQTRLMEREAAPMAMVMFKTMLENTCAAFGPGVVADGVRAAASLAEAGRTFDAMRALRALFPLEAALMPQTPASPAQ
jgi:flagellar protein FlbT